MKKVVIFYSKTAGGHLRTAEAIADQLKQNHNLDIIMHDGLEQTSFGFKINPATSFGILSIPLLPLYNLLYLLTNTSLGIKALRRFIKLFWGRQLKKTIEYYQPDLIITTHHFISPSTIHTLKRKYPFITIVTDLGKPHRIWFDKGSDKIITPTPQLAELAQILLKSTDDQVIQLGYPLKEQFKPSSFKKFHDTILIMGGGAGSGRIEEQVKLLQKELSDKKLMVICGFNKNLYHKLTKIKANNTTLYQFVDNIFQLMDLSDIVITKAGPGTIIEAAQMRKPMIITDWVGRQEKENVKFVVDNNLGFYCPNLNELPEYIGDIYQNYSKYTANQKNWSGLNSIVTFLNNAVKD